MKKWLVSVLMRICRATNEKPLPSSSKNFCSSSMMACSNALSLSWPDSGNCKNSST
jgi:hypothetical protein